MANNYTPVTRSTLAGRITVTITCPAYSVLVWYNPADTTLRIDGDIPLSFPPPPTLHPRPTPPPQTMHAEQHVAPRRMSSGLALLVLLPLLVLVLLVLSVIALAAASCKPPPEGWRWGGDRRRKWRIAPCVAHLLAPEGSDTYHVTGTLSTNRHTSLQRASSVLVHSP